MYKYDDYRIQSCASAALNCSFKAKHTRFWQKEYGYESWSWLILVINIHNETGTREKVRIIEKSG